MLNARATARAAAGEVVKIAGFIWVKAQGGDDRKEKSGARGWPSGILHGMMRVGAMVPEALQIPARRVAGGANL